ncbi:GT2 family glycosyltransferase [Angulomicrobium tetraedrale]|uniref:GT2 family glycosyltransferase n=1 Tax=Ancylobacter tetraedralis TaxID=217068 RepID=A0A839ZG12_9HYPH|nr:glycosyltransferase [Ancylobacter tetraedralis]MBB3773714.1 GT2 family glycosyltransferase [Ancylobacter tetraedralis]
MTTNGDPPHREPITSGQIRDARPDLADLVSLELLAVLFRPLARRPWPAATDASALCVPARDDARGDDELRALAGAAVVLRPDLASARGAAEAIAALATADFVLTASLPVAMLAAACRIPFAFWDDGRPETAAGWREFADRIGIDAPPRRTIPEGRAVYDTHIRPALAAAAPGPAPDSSLHESERLRTEAVALGLTLETARLTAEQQTRSAATDLAASHLLIERLRRKVVDSETSRRRAEQRLAVVSTAGDRLAEELRRAYSRPLRPLKSAIERAVLHFRLLFEGSLLSPESAERLRLCIAEQKPAPFRRDWFAARSSALPAARGTNPEGGTAAPLSAAAGLRAPTRPAQPKVTISLRRYLHVKMLRLAARLASPFSKRTKARFRRSADKRDPRVARPTALGPGVETPNTPRRVIQQKNALAAIGAETQVRVPTSEQPVVSIIVPTYGQVDYTMRCLASLAVNPPRLPFEVIVMDDAFPGPEVERLHRGIEGVRVIRNEVNKGFLLTCNAAAKASRGEFLLFLNNDTEVMPGAVDALVDPLRADPGIGMTGSKLVYPTGRLQEAGGIIWSDGSGWNVGRNGDPDRPEYDYRREVDYISGASIMVAAALFADLGGFDPAFAPAYCEDSDLAFRIRQRGLKVVYEPRSVVIHFEGISHGTDVNSGLKAYQVTNTERLKNRWKEVLEREHCATPAEFARARDRARHRPVILVVDHYVPEPDRDAGSRTMMSFLVALREADWVVKFWPENRLYSATYTPPLQDLGIEVLDARWPGNFENWMRTNGAFVDHVLVSRPTVAREVLMPLITLTSARLSYYGHDLHFLRMKRQADVLGDARLMTEAQEIERLERRLWRQFDVVFYPSQVEADLVQAGAPGTLAKAVIPFCYDHFEERAAPAPGQLILFVAGFAHAPNVDAAEFLVSEVMPLVHERLPDARLALVGSNPTPAVRALADDHTEVSGWVSDERLQAYYRQARVAVVPLRFGGGVKSKVIEAMAMGLPLVTTPMGAEGIDGLERIAAIHEDPRDIAASIVDLIAADDAWMRASQAGIDYARRHFSRGALKDSLLAALVPRS